MQTSENQPSPQQTQIPHVSPTIHHVNKKNKKNKTARALRWTFTFLFCLQVEVLASTPRLMLIRNFLSPSECEEIKKTATPKLEPSTVLAQGDQSKGEMYAVCVTCGVPWLHYVARTEFVTIP